MYSIWQLIESEIDSKKGSCSTHTQQRIPSPKKLELSRESEPSHPTRTADHTQKVADRSITRLGGMEYRVQRNATQREQQISIDPVPISFCAILWTLFDRPSNPINIPIYVRCKNFLCIYNINNELTNK